jgi:predicted nucleotidyltransferase
MDNSTKFGLPESDLGLIITELSNNKNIDEAILFGSRAKGNYKNGSDIDIALKGEGINLNDILDLSIAVEKLNLPYKLDLIIYNRIKENALIGHINRVGVLLFKRNAQYPAASPHI